MFMFTKLLQNVPQMIKPAGGSFNQNENPPTGALVGGWKGI